MVMFVCNMCGESLKKNKVEEHYKYRCRNCDAVSCMDCGKDFWGNDYMEHNKCISEQEKYQGTPADNKGEAKQEQWVANVTSAIKDYSGNPKVRNLLQMCVDCPNLPRKQKKFVNFVNSAFHERNQAIVGEAWDIIEKASKLDINKGHQEVNAASNSSANHLPEQESSPTKSSVKDTSQLEASLSSTDTLTEELSATSDLEPNRNHVNKTESSSAQSNGAISSSCEDEQNGIEEPQEQQSDSVVESEKAKKKKAKKEKKEQLAALQNCEGKKMSKKQLKRLREESISLEIASVEESANSQLTNGDHASSRKDKKNKKKQRDHKESVHEVIVENGEQENEGENDDEEDEKRKPDILAQVRLDDKTMKGIPKNINIDPEEAQEDEESEKKDRHFNWHKAIKAALKAEEDRSLSMKKLRKKVLAEFMTYGGDGKFKHENEIWALFDKKLHTYPKVKIQKDRVTLTK